MPSYRPKSLDELNNTYDKKIAAENAMKKGSSRFSEPAQTDVKPPVYEPYVFDESKNEKGKTESVGDITNDVNDFIKSFGQTEEKKIAKAPQTVHPVQTRVNSTKIPSKAKGKPVNSQNKKVESVKAQERSGPVISSEINDLMDDYMKIMSDEDDGALSLKERLSSMKKDKAAKKESKKSKNTHHETDENDNVPQQQDQASTVSADEIEEVSFAADEQVNEINAPVTVPPVVSPVVLEDTETNSVQNEIPEQVNYDPAQVMYEDIPEQWQQEDKAENDNDSQYEYDYNADDTQQYDEYYEQEQHFESFAESEPEKRKGGAAKIISLLVLLSLLILTASVGALKYVINVDTGKAIFDKYYVFTAKHDLLTCSISTGDLVISENRELKTGDAFVYYNNTSFCFAKLTDSAVSNTDVVLALTDNSQVMASTGNVRGAVLRAIPYAGKAVGFIMDNFLAVFAVLACNCLLFVIITAVLFSKGRKKEELMFELDDEEEYYEQEQYEENSESSEEERNEASAVESSQADNHQNDSDTPYDEDVQHYDLADDDYYDESFEQSDTDE